nr:MAG TPA: hypothetical protein [Caudoviricetes sp.]
MSHTILFLCYNILNDNNGKERTCEIALRS